MFTRSLHAAIVGAAAAGAGATALNLKPTGVVSPSAESAPLLKINSRETFGQQINRIKAAKKGTRSWPEEQRRAAERVKRKELMGRVGANVRAAVHIRKSSQRG